MNRFNGPVGYNDRANEFDLNQFYVIAERVTKVENDCGIDYGYRADLVYGTDRRFVQTIRRHAVGQCLGQWQPLLRPCHAAVVWPVAIQQADSGRRPLLCPLRV